MEIFNNNRIQQAANIYKQQDVNNRKTGYGDQQSSVQKPDSIELSSASQEIFKIKAMLDSTPDVDEQRIEDLRSSIADGTYRVDSRDIAKAMLKEMSGE